MPSKSKSQHRLMAAVGHDPTFAKKVGIPQKVGMDFYNADVKAGKFKPKKSPKVAFGKRGGEAP